MNETNETGCYEFVLPLSTRFLLLFVRKKVVFNHDEGVVQVWKSLRGLRYLLHEEPIAYGDRRNAQLNRWGL